MAAAKVGQVQDTTEQWTVKPKFGSEVMEPIRGFPKMRGTFGGTHNKNYSRLGVHIGVPLFMETTKKPYARLLSRNSNRLSF